MTLEVMDYDKTMERVVELDLHGLNPTQIARETGLKRTVVMSHLAEVREAWIKDSEARDMARDHLNKMVSHYDHLIKQMYDLLGEAESLDLNDRMVAQRAGILKSIADLERQRVDLLQKAGILEASDIGDEIAQWEDEKEQMLNILRNLCPQCQANVGAKIAALRGKPEVIEAEVVR